MMGSTHTYDIGKVSRSWKFELVNVFLNPVSIC
jgi:hypothetical protein